ncbi:type IV pilin [Natrinema sp. H-ect1]|uniref:type IV pilin n=1 Tax=Natrinema sp. H-ect1 TaxID=3242700 RepID=UPI00359E61A7
MDLTKYRSKLIGDDGERAVSPVIGVILMVAITVILAAVIAAFVLDLGQGQSANAQAGISFDENSGNVTATVNSIERADELYISGTGDCSYLYDSSGGSGAEEKSLGTNAGATAEVHFEDTPSGKLSSGYICDDDNSFDDGTAVSSGSIQIIGEYDGSRTVISEYELD